VTHEEETEVPPGTPILSESIGLAVEGVVTYLTRGGRRIAAVVPVELAESIPPAPPAEGDNSAPRAGGCQRILEQLAREQGVRPVTDPAELLGPGMPDDEFAAFFKAATSGRSCETDLPRDPGAS
jgi:hypothetical protein